MQALNSNSVDLKRVAGGFDFDFDTLAKIGGALGGLFGGYVSRGTVVTTAEGLAAAAGVTGAGAGVGAVAGAELYIVYNGADYLLNDFFGLSTAINDVIDFLGATNYSDTLAGLSGSCGGD